MIRHVQLFAVSALLTGGLAAQWPRGGQPPYPGQVSPGQQGQQTQQTQQPGRAGSATSPLQGGVYREGFQGLQSVYPRYPSYPSYPPGFGPQPVVHTPGDPTLLLQGLIPGLGPLRPAGAPATAGTWPSWLGDELSPDERLATPERVVLARLADRVWFFAAGDNAFVPLAFYDKIRTLGDGAVVEVRTKGEFQCVFHDGAQLRSNGRARVAFGRMTEAVAELTIERFRTMWLQAQTRAMRVVLPDSSVLELQGCSVSLECRGGRGVVHNHGPKAATWHGRPGGINLPAAHRLEFMTEVPTQRYLTADLDLQGAVRASRDQRVLEVHADGVGAVVWSGARFRLVPGSAIRIDPLAGRRFPETAPTVRTTQAQAAATKLEKTP